LLIENSKIEFSIHIHAIPFTN